MISITIIIMDRFGTVRTTKDGNCLDTVRALHETVVSLRTALEKSRNEINELKTKTATFDYPLENVIQSLAIENHLLRRRIIEDTKQKQKVRSKSEDVKRNDDGEQEQKEKSSVTGAKIKLPKSGTKKVSRSLENLQSNERSTKGANQKFSDNLTKTVSFSSFCDKVPAKSYYFFDKMSFDDNAKSTESASLEKSDSVDNADLEQDQEVDEVELIFTTDDTKEHDFKEALVSIDETILANNQAEEDAGGGKSSQLLLKCPTSDLVRSHESNLSCELDDDVFNDDNATGQSKKSNESVNNRDEEKSLKSYYSYQDSSFENRSLEKDESFDRFDERIRIIETDISKIGIQEVEYTALGRRNTCPNPLQYKPISHREALSRGMSTRKSRPILAHSNAIRKESGAQTDISALPGGSSWRSESSLAHKVKGSEHFTTLPSKFPLPGSKLRLSDKTVEARRVLLSDIGFTSMVPELSRSADHICPPTLLKPPNHMSSFGQFLRTPDLYSPGFASQRFTWTTTTGSPSECSRTQSRYGSMYPMTSMSPLMAHTRRCSAPVSPSRRSVTALMKPTQSNRVKFANGSLPELRTEWTTMDSSGGDSTDSLVDEAENYLRRSIECIAEKDYYVRNSDGGKGATRRASAPEAARDNVPPQGWQPFLPRLPRDLRLDYWVKVITSEGRVRGGRVRYVGPLASSQSEHFVGVQLSTPEGISDGTFNNKRYFNCEAYHGIFVPFKKVVMGWRP